jgi:hypothetical protein
MTVPQGDPTLFGVGWNLDSNTWTRVSNTQFTVSSATNFTNRYLPGVKLTWAESGTIKYGVVASSSFASSTTTVNLVPTTDYVMSASPDAATTCLSLTHPPGFPSRFLYAPTVTGFSTAPATSLSWWNIQNGLCTLSVAWLTAGTSNANTFTVALPIAASTVGLWLTSFDLPAALDGGTGITLGTGTVSATATSATLSNGTGTTSWATSGAKNASFTVTYPI